MQLFYDEQQPTLLFLLLVPLACTKLVRLYCSALSSTSFPAAAASICFSDKFVISLVGTNLILTKSCCCSVSGTGLFKP